MEHWICNYACSVANLWKFIFDKATWGATFSVWCLTVRYISMLKWRCAMAIWDIGRSTIWDLGRDFPRNCKVYMLVLSKSCKIEEGRGTHLWRAHKTHALIGIQNPETNRGRFLTKKMLLCVIHSKWATRFSFTLQYMAGSWAERLWHVLLARR